MGKVTFRKNFRVVVEPIKPSFMPQYQEEYEETMAQVCKRLVEKIRRHVDDVEYVYWECEHHAVCSHCGLDWEALEDGQPVCCEDAIREWETRND